MTPREKTLSLILRASLAFAFAYPAINGFFEPYNWIGYFPSFVTGYLPDETLLLLFAVIELIIALWLLIGWHVVIASSIATITLIAIVLLNLGDIDVLFRDIPIAAIGVALILLHRQKNTP